MADDDSPPIKNIKLDESCTSTASMSTAAPTSGKDHPMNLSVYKLSDLRMYPAFIDKSLLIKEVFSGNSKIALVAPRRFGKTVNIHMLKDFVEKLDDEEETMNKNRQSFTGLNISKETAIALSHQGQYPVIFLNYKSPTSIYSLEDARRYLGSNIHDAFKSHSYLQKSGKLNDSEKEVVDEWCHESKFKTFVMGAQDIALALRQLAEYLYKHHEHSVFVLVDEYDGICCDAVLNLKNEDVLKEIIDMCMGSLATLLKDNPHVDRGFVTGISSLTTIGLSNLNTVTFHKFQYPHSFAKFYGLENSEVHDKLKTLNRISEFGEIVAYYNGYREEILSTWSVMSYLNNTRLANYWTSSGVAVGLLSALRITKIRTMVLELLSNTPIEIQVFEKLDFTYLKRLKEILQSQQPDLQNVDIYFNFLLEQGYLAIAKLYPEVDEIKKIDIRIPNREIKCEFRMSLIENGQRDYNLDMNAVKQCAQLFDKICDSTAENEKLFNDSIIPSLKSIIQKAKLTVINEATFHHILYVILIHCSTFECFSKVRSSSDGRQRLDLLLIKKSYKIGVILELEYQKPADEAINQIFANKYWQAFLHERYNPEKKSVEYSIFIGLSVSDLKELDVSIRYNPDTKQTSPKKADRGEQA